MHIASSLIRDMTEKLSCLKIEMTIGNVPRVLNGYRGYRVSKRRTVYGS